ncbi:hypothetical protein [Kistimonas asteriae]|uniref:hypothetical protein n=1 Tax=Kistimonas asteriae TaxID=517724 RepID=UPI001BA43EBA|nr:hypothetical protein [Kistimonas asteriae]
MRALKLSALGAAVMAATAATAAQASFEQLVDDSSLTLTYKMYKWDQENKNNQGKYKDAQDEFVHALIADYKSGYFADIIGFDFQVGMARDINSDDKFSGTNLPGGGSNGHLDDIAGVQQAYLKAKFGGEDLNVYGTYGQKKRDLQSYSDSGSRILNASSFGADVVSNIHGLNLYATRIDAFSARNQSTFKDDLKNSNGQTIDDVMIYGAGYEWNGLGGVLEQAKSQDYLKKTIAKVYYTLPVSENVSVDFDARYGKVEKDGKLYDTAFLDANGNYESSYNNLNATLNIGNAYVGVGYNKTKDGDYDNKLFSNDHGSFNSSLDLEMGYNYEDEKAYVVKAGYDFADYVPGLGVNVWYAKGKDAKDFENFNQKEVGANVSYNFSGKLDGLSLVYFHTAYRTSGDYATGRDDALGGMYNTNINRVYLTYTYEVF